MNRNRFFLLLVFIAIKSLSLSCAPGFLRPEEYLWGHWRNINNQASVFSTTGDLEFKENGQLLLMGGPYTEEVQYDYVIIAPGQIKLTAGEHSEIFRYKLDRDELILIIEGAQIIYERITSITPFTDEINETSMTSTMLITSTYLSPSETPSPLTTTNTEVAIIGEPSKTPTLLTLTIEIAPYITPTPARYYPLPNCAASQLHLGDSAFIDYDGGRNSLRDTPDTHPSDNIIGYIYPGEVVEIVGGPVCNYGWVLWEVMTTRYEYGWTPETNGNEFWLLPLTTHQFCLDTLPARLVEGQQAFVMEEYDISNFIRESPSLSAEIITRVRPGGQMLVLEGPLCSNSSNWWKIQAANTSIIGWTRENDAGRYFLAPIP